MFHYTVLTEQSVDEACQNLEEKLKEEKFGVLWDFNIKDKLNEKGLEFERSFRILEVCNPAEAQRVLNQNVMIGYFLPCKMVVYEDEGVTKIGMPKPTALVTMVEDEEITAMAQEIEHRLMACMDKSV
ncbi:DUF302 domain-containing protein [Alkalihalobacillus sp. AL-G]|uniref:DUF302 domain-containing protein n=1 Tax=Alkalihalobacillus sp. AL-G TaxID=2926399 RepID=UPI00272B648D|nr:DUF302 domain-containing protein [Alkalihalobacillus sp. AL-G]WLD93628.1 DUF302 domain-containing protein [Alkalihalobacillus sp. AL-G]